MRTMHRIAVALIALAIAAPAAYAGHGSNNMATLSGAPASGIQGIALVNFNVGNGSWVGEVTVQGLAAGSYAYAVNLGGTNQTSVCEFNADGSGQAGCSALFDPPGFDTGVILDMNGNVVASGTFERRGGERSETPAQD